MAGPTDQDRAFARGSRLVAVVIAATVVLWLGAQWLGRRLGWDPSLTFLFDLAAGAAFLWALIVTFGIWRRQNRGTDK